MILDGILILEKSQRVIEESHNQQNQVNLQLPDSVLFIRRLALFWEMNPMSQLEQKHIHHLGIGCENWEATIPLLSDQNGKGQQDGMQWFLLCATSSTFHPSVFLEKAVSGLLRPTLVPILGVPL
jgi:hypothetical protein